MLSTLMSTSASVISCLPDRMINRPRTLCICEPSKNGLIDARLTTVAPDASVYQHRKMTRKRGGELTEMMGAPTIG
jgi:hypothetical protein